jgi:hypothetical protein
MISQSTIDEVKRLEEKQYEEYLKSMTEPKAGEYWWVTLPKQTTLVKMTVYEITPKVVSLYANKGNIREYGFNPKYCATTYKRSDIEFVEKV